MAHPEMADVHPERLCDTMDCPRTGRDGKDAGLAELADESLVIIVEAGPVERASYRGRGDAEGHEFILEIGDFSQCRKAKP